MSYAKNQVPSEEEIQVENAKNLKKINSNQLLPVLPKKTPWQEAIENLLISNLEKDVKITIGQQSFECHSCVLRTFCELFADTLQPGSSVSLPEDKITAESFDIAYNWMISSDSNCQRGKLMDLLLAAEYLCAPKLLQSVFGALNDVRYFSNVDALNCYIEACTKGIMNVADLMIDRFGKSFLVLVSSEEYRELEVNLLCNLLSSDLLGVHTEVEVFYAALMWVLTDYAERKVHMRRVLKTVRFELMPSLVLLNFGERLNELMPDAVDLMFFLLHLAVINSQERSNKTLNKLGERHRIYIRDPLCPYLQLLDSRTEELSATMFKDYIVSLEDSFEEFQARITELVDEDDEDEDYESEEDEELGDYEFDEEEDDVVDVEEGDEEDVDVELLTEEAEQETML
ncbi:kelch-like protein 41 [Drosophila hydei]|uniref:Kelch-like protein 41 n=1 Tax=Drosophila hydei TaxID=7224 RepID=A0A6J1M2C7_DROHY|nr:kelch-like protein 41 [Drosophila hydei]